MTAVIGPGGAGSGYEVAPGLVLTSAHVVTTIGASVSVLSPGRPGEFTGRVVWCGTAGGADDAALVAVDDDSWEPVLDRALWGGSVTHRPGIVCEVWGVSDPDQRTDRPINAVRATGTFNAGDRIVGGRYVVRLNGIPPESDSPWRARSGATLLSDGLVIGVIVAEPAARGHAVLEAVPVSVLLDNPDFTVAIDRHTGSSMIKSDAVELSESMLTVAAAMPRPPSEVTAIAIASAIAERHPEYAGGRLGTVAFVQPSSAEASRTWPDWYAAVAGWFDGDALARAGHEVLDGRLFLFGLGLTDNALHDTLQRAGGWGPLAVEIDIAVAPVGSRLWSVLNGVRFANGYQSDRASGQDQLGIQGEVNAVCEVIIDPAVTPPLSIGLFGEWGAGKSFFMEKMRERITERAQMPDMAEFSVVQVRFNAWHYADTSLWASLAIEIFERLVDPEPVDVDDRHQWLCGHGDAHRAQREELLKQLETYRDAKSQLDAERSHLQAERDQVAQRRQDAAQKHHETIKKVRLTDVAAELVKNAEVHAALKEVSDELGFTPAAEDLAELGKELRTTAGYLPGIWRFVRHKRWAVVLTAAFVALVLAAPALAMRGGLAWLLPLAGSIGTITAATALLRPAVRKVNTALGHVETAIRVASQVRETLQTRRGLEERSLELELVQIEREIAETTQTIASLDDKIASTEAAAKALTVGRKLHDFLAERAAGYQKHQGVVGMLHRDFRFLDAQLRSYQDSAERHLPRIDRVVLYIDDLDRCPPAKVLEVLEAVHLLLALELFVVVVGVDPRWLQRSLRHQYRDLSAGNDPFADPYLHSMPIEYLEKIFQIPLTLSAMEPSGYARLIGSLAASVTTETRRR